MQEQGDKTSSRQPNDFNIKHKINANVIRKPNDDIRLLQEIISNTFKNDEDIFLPNKITVYVNSEEDFLTNHQETTCNKKRENGFRTHKKDSDDLGELFNENDDDHKNNNQINTTSHIHF